MALGDEENKQPQNGEPNNAGPQPEDPQNNGPQPGGAPEENVGGNIINEEGNIINEADDDLNDSYIDEDEFGYQIDDRLYEAKVTEGTASDNPFRDALRADRVVAPQRFAGPEPVIEEAPKDPALSELYPRDGDILTEHRIYDVMHRCLNAATPKFTSVDQAREYHNYLTAVELLSGDEQSLTREARFPLSVNGEIFNTGFTSTVRSREEAWNIVHSPGRLNRIMNMPAGNGTVRQQIDSMTRDNNHAYMRNKSADYIRSREGQEYPYRNTAAPRIYDRNKRFEGNSIYTNAADFAARYNDSTERNELRSLNMQQIRQQLQTEPEGPRRQYLEDLAYFFEAVRDGQGIRGNEADLEQKSIHEMTRDMDRTDRNRIYMDHIGDPRFERSLKTLNDHEYKAVGDPSINEIQRHTQQLLASPQVRNASSGVNALIKAVGNGDAGKLEELSRQNEGYAQLLSLNYLYNVMSQEMDLNDVKLGSETPFAYFFDTASNSDGFKKLCEKHAYDPIFRKGLNAMENMAALANDGEDPYRREAAKRAKNADSMINEKIMKDTLAPISSDQLKNLNEEMKLEGDTEKLTEAVEKNMKQQEVMAKMLFMTQLSGARIVVDSDEGEDIISYNESAADLFAHGDKIEFHLPNGSHNEKAKIYDSILGKDFRKGEDGLYRRHKISHRRLAARTYNQDNTIEYGGGETRGINYGGSNVKMNMSVGGLGNTGADGKPITADGKHGTGYLKLMNGYGEDDGATILFGVETDAPRKEKQSAFLSGKRPRGNELGGRVVDLHHLPAESLANLMDRFGKYYKDLQKAALTDPEKARELEELNGTLSGVPMSKQQLTVFMSSKLRINPQTGGRIVDAAAATSDAPQTDAMNVVVPPADDPEANMDAAQKENLRREEKLKLDSTVRSKLFERELKTTGSRPREDAQNEDEAEAEQPAQNLRTLGSYLLNGANRLNGLSEKEQNKVICSMIGATVLTNGKTTKRFDPEKIDYKKIAKIPSVEYQLKYDRQKLLRNAGDGKPMKLMEGSVKLNEMLAGDQANTNQTRAKLRELYDEMNVPNLKDRSKEYQRMVKAIGQAVLKPELTSEDRLNVINAVNNYTSQKRYIPRSDDGKISLFNAFKAMEAVVPASYDPRRKFITPHMEHFQDLQTAMERRGLLEGPPQAQQNNGRPEQGGPAV